MYSTEITFDLFVLHQYVRTRRNALECDLRDFLFVRHTR